jgi:hypothetical protein
VHLAYLLLLSTCARSPLQVWVHHHLIHLLRELRQVLACSRVAAVGAVPLREVLEARAAATHAASEAAVGQLTEVVDVPAGREKQQSKSFGSAVCSWLAAVDCGVVAEGSCIEPRVVIRFPERLQLCSWGQCGARPHETVLLLMMINVTTGSACRGTVAAAAPCQSALQSTLRDRCASAACHCSAAVAEVMLTHSSAGTAPAQTACLVQQMPSWCRPLWAAPRS